MPPPWPRRVVQYLLGLGAKSKDKPTVFDSFDTVSRASDTEPLDSGLPADYGRSRRIEIDVPIGARPFSFYLSRSPLAPDDARQVLRCGEVVRVEAET